MGLGSLGRTDLMSLDMLLVLQSGNRGFVREGQETIFVGPKGALPFNPLLDLLLG